MNPLLNYLAPDWRSLHDNASSMAKNTPNRSWGEPLMRLAQAAMELEELTVRCVLDGPEEDEAHSWGSDPTP